MEKDRKWLLFRGEGERVNWAPSGFPGLVEGGVSGVSRRLGHQHQHQHQHQHHNTESEGTEVRLQMLPNPPHSLVPVPKAEQSPRLDSI
jgi:hypothetical protein